MLKLNSNFEQQKLNNFCSFFELDYPIIQAGMVWTSGANLVSACANEGIMGTLGAGSMPLEVLKVHLDKVFSQTQKQHHDKIAINLPLLYHGIEQQIKMALDAGIKTFITSAGSPKKFTKLLKAEGRKVIHVTSSTLLAKKCEDAGVDAVVAEGFEAGGHNGRDETTTLVLIPSVVEAVNIPVIAAGGIATANQALACHILGASAVQIGSRFAVTKEASSHLKFKERVINAKEGETKLRLKQHIPVRLLDNEFSQEIADLEVTGPSVDDLLKLLGKGRAKAGIFDGDLVQGELEIGQVSAMISDLPSAKEIIDLLKSIYTK